jgi:hypothetical protein
LIAFTAWPATIRANNAGAVVIVNSESPRYLDFIHFIQPYLGNFGVPYNVVDISSNSITTNLTNYALIIIGHAQLDTNQVYLTQPAQAAIASAVSNGVGLVSFDNILSSNSSPLYSYEQSIFGFSYNSSVTSGHIVFPPTQPSSQMHYITSLHQPNETLLLSNATSVTTMTIAGLSLPTNDTAIATCGSSPFVVISQYGQGRAVQWASYDWMSSTIQGPINGLDDLLWRGFVWSAHKPFVMRGMPHFATMRIDDVTGDEYYGSGAPPPFWWIHEMTNAGFKPWLGLFIDDITTYSSTVGPKDGRLNDLSNLVASGSVTASVHSFSATQSGPTNFFYFNHATESQYSDAEMTQNYQRGTAFLSNNNIPSSTVVIAHYSEVGTNAFNGLTNWGVQFFMDEVVPGTVEYASPGAPWIVAGPYRLYETPRPGQVNMPMFYADWLTVPNHPELNGKFFDCYTEIRNASPIGEWAPTNEDVAGSITRGYQMLKRGFDSMTLGNIFTHEFFIDTSDGPAYGDLTTNNFATILSGITNDVASYNPIYVTLDYGCQYVRATRTSQLTSADYDPISGQISATFSGYTDIPITAYYYTGADSAITNIPATVPVISGSTNVVLAAGKAVLLVSADPKSRMYGLTNPPLTYTISGFAGTDTVAQVSGTAGLTTPADTNSPVGSYPILVTNLNLSAGNYAFAFSNGIMRLTATPPQILSITGAGTTNVVITWSALSNATYRLLYETNAPFTNWQSISPDVTATNGSASQVDNPQDDQQRFYEIMVPQ